MKKEEALNILYNASVYHPDYLDALNMAIEALERELKMESVRGDIPIQPTIPKMPSIQEPYKVYVSKQEVFEQINCWIGSGEYRYTNATNYLLKRIKELQGVNPQKKWIKTETQLPPIGEWVLVATEEQKPAEVMCYQGMKTNIKWHAIGVYEEYQYPSWTSGHGDIRGSHPIAWMPLLPSYQRE